VSVSSYAVLLRGVNVGRHNRIAMPALRELLEGLGYAGVRTHLQSGNALISTQRRSAEGVSEEIESALASRHRLDVRVLVRPVSELAKVVAANPLLAPGRDGAKQLVLFCFDKPGGQRLKVLAERDYAPEECALGRKEIYLWCPNGLHKSAVVKAFDDKALGVTTTARNQNTLSRLLELAGCSA
jgi:uncharacterized protein (DUF1697 family)